MVRSSNSLVMHDDVLHTGSAKRGGVSGVKGIDAGLNLTPKAVMADIDVAILNAANGIMGLDAGGKAAVANLPVNVASGIAGLDASTLITLAQLRTNVNVLLPNIDTSTASGTQAVTGAGFAPTMAIIIAIVASTPEISIGVFKQGGSARCVASNYNVTAGTWTNTAGVVYLIQTNSINYFGVISSWDADGFTFTWTKTGAKTGTANIYAIVMK